MSRGADLNRDGVVNAQDLAILLANWGREAVGFPDLGDDGEWTPRDAPCCVDLNCCHPNSCGCSGCPEMCGGGLPGCEPTSVTPCENEIPCVGEGCDDDGDGGDGGPEPPCEDCPEPPCPDCPDLCPDPPCEDPCPEPPCKNGANCIVEIIGCPDPAYLCLVNDGLPRELNLAAAGGPSGGEYKWSVTGATIAIDPITGLPADSDQWVTILVSEPGIFQVSVEYTVNDCNTKDSCEFIVPTLETTTPVEIRYRTFIGCQVIEMDLGWPTVPRYFGGDNRTFSYNAGTNRSFQDVAVSFNPYLPGPVVAGPVLAFGATNEYGAGWVGPSGQPYCTLAFVPGAIPVNTATAAVTPQTNRITVTMDNPHRMRIHIHLKGTLPLAPPGSPAIDVDVTVHLRNGCNDETGDVRVEYRVEGKHDAFPWHELYINGQEVYRFDAEAAGSSPFDLFGPPVSDWVHPHQHRPEVADWRPVP